jgi:hypothetical protein
MSANSRLPRGANRALLLREAAFVLLLCAVFGTAYAASTFDYRRSQSRSATELQATVAEQLSQAQALIAEIADAEGRFNSDLFAAVGVSGSEIRDSSAFPPDLTRVLLQQEAAREAWADIVNCPATTPFGKDAESLVAELTTRAKLQIATEGDRRALAVMLADLSKRLEAVKARAKDLEHVRFMVEAERLESPGRK